MVAIVFALKRIAQTQTNLSNSQKNDTPPYSHLLTVSHFPLFKNLPSTIIPTAGGPAVLWPDGCCVFAQRAGGLPVRG